MVCMIATLRRTHRVLFLMLALILPAIFTIGLMEKQNWKWGTTDLPADFQAIRAADLSDSVALHSSLASISGDLAWHDGDPVVMITQTEPLAYPDILVYWSDAADELSRLPDEAILLGAFADLTVVFPVPAAALDETDPQLKGQLIVYTLGHREIIATISQTTRSPATTGEVEEQ